MIHSFGNKLAESLFHRRKDKYSRKFPNESSRRASMQLQHLNSARQLDDLRSPPGNRLEKLRGDFKGWHSIRINDQWRIVFQWENDGATNVKILDYH